MVNKGQQPFEFYLPEKHDRGEPPALTVISLGAGVQSSTMALMAAEGLILPRPDYAIFADTGWEPEGVYHHLDWLEEQLPFPVLRVRTGDLRSDLLAGTNHIGNPFISVPVFFKDNAGKSGMTRRQCTREYKIMPIERKLRDLLGLAAGQRCPASVYVNQWIGISLDEVFRMKDNPRPWIDNQWPLIDMKMSRDDCREWFAERYPARTLPRSACIGCPYHTGAVWSRMKRDDATSWEDAVFVDRKLREGKHADLLNGVPYLHRDLIPLGEVVFAEDEDDDAEGAFDEECEGMCGV